jgi:hypothetical protein
VSDDKCCGWPELGVCEDCPDPEVIAWAKEWNAQKSALPHNEKVQEYFRKCEEWQYKRRIAKEAMKNNA